MSAEVLQVPHRGTWVDDEYGPLILWERPVPGYQYAVGVDTSSGIRASARENDPSAACVIELRSCRQVAEMHGYVDPTRWGFLCARLGWFYNVAPVAIETHPSPHGLTAYNAAERYGYPKLWAQEKEGTIERGMSTRKGWQRSAHSTLDLYNRIREALLEQCPIRSPALIDELSAVRLENGKPVSTLHDDRIIAYAIALKVRDAAYLRGEVETPKEPVRDLAQLWWERQAEMERLGNPEPEGDPLDDAWDGV